ncbi:MAG: lyase family protein, partial [Pseudomonadota bacterium]
GFGDEGERIASHMAGALGLAAGPVWHTDRTAVAEYAGRLSLVTGSLGKFGQDVTLMAQQGVDEITLRGGGGSSAMPHKSNPVIAELLVTLARFNATQISGLHQALVHEQERSGAAWMLEWMILPQMSVVAARALSAACALCDQVERIGA